LAIIIKCGNDNSCSNTSIHNCNAFKQDKQPIPSTNLKRNWHKLNENWSHSQQILSHHQIIILHRGQKSKVARKRKQRVNLSQSFKEMVR
jgi:hypothetical protein